MRKKQIEGKKQGEEMTFTVFGKERIEKLLLINILGTLEALKNKKVTIDESEKVVFTPYTFFYIEEKGYQQKNNRFDS